MVQEADLGKVVVTFHLMEKTWWESFTWLAVVILEVLRQFKDAPRNGYPSLLETEEEDRLDPSDGRVAQLAAEWEGILDTMVAGFRVLSQYDIMTTAEDMAKADEALLLFAIYFVHLWD